VSWQEQEELNKLLLMKVCGRDQNHHHTTTILWPFFRDHPGELVPEENVWTLWCKGRLTEADTPTIWLGVTPSELTSAHLHDTPFFTGRMPFQNQNVKLKMSDCVEVIFSLCNN